MERLRLDIQRFATGGGGEYYIEFFTAKGDYGQGSWDEVDLYEYKLHSVPTIDDSDLRYYGYSSLVDPHFMGWTLYGNTYTVEELKTKTFMFYGEPPSEATAWVIDRNNDRRGAAIGDGNFTDIKLNGDTIKGIYYNGMTVWSGGVHDTPHIWVEFHNPYIDVSTGGIGEFAVYLIGDFCNWNLSSAILMQGTNGVRRAELPISRGESMECKFYVKGWDNPSQGIDDGWQTSTYPLNNDGNIQISYDGTGYIFVYRGNSYEVKGAIDTIISDNDYQSEK